MKLEEPESPGCAFSSGSDFRDASSKELKSRTVNLCEWKDAIQECWLLFVTNFDGFGATSSRSPVGDSLSGPHRNALLLEFFLRTSYNNIQLDKGGSGVRVLLPIAAPKAPIHPIRARVSDLLTRDVDQPVHASRLALHSSRNRRASRSVRNAHEIQSASAAIPSKSVCKETRMCTPEEASAFFVERRMSQSLYQWSRMSALSKGHKLHLSFRELQQARTRCTYSAR